MNAFRQLARGARSRRDDEVLLDGVHLLKEAIDAGLKVRTVLATAAVLERDEERTTIAQAARKGAEVYDVPGAVIDAASPVRTTTGLVAIAEWTPRPIAATLEPPPALAIGLLDVQDPGNVGAVIRSADALSATGVIALDQTAHPAGWKALRGAMGSTFRLPVARGSVDQATDAARARHVQVIGAVTNARRSIQEFDFRRPTLVLLGNEGAGLPANVVATANTVVSVAMRRGVESLNVAVTAALILYEARRQRAKS